MSHRRLMGHSLRWIVVLLLLLLSAALLLRPTPLAVTIATVSRGALTQWLLADGVSRVRHRYQITAPLAATLERPDCVVGRTVMAGEPLLTLYPLPPPPLDQRQHATAVATLSERQAQQQAAAAMVQQAQTTVLERQRQAERLAALRGQDQVSEQSAEEAAAAAQRASSALIAATAAHQQAVAAVQAAAIALHPFPLPLVEPAPLLSPHGSDRVLDPLMPIAPLRLYAPISGQILACHRDSGGIVSSGEALLTLADPTDLELAIDLLSTEAVTIEPGMALEVVVWGGSEVLAAQVRQIEPIAFTEVSALGVSEQRVWVIADLRLPVTTTTRLGDGYRIEVRFRLWHGADVLQLPIGALFRDAKSRWALFRIEQGRVVQQPVSIGHRSDSHVELLSGVAEGDRVVLYPDPALADGVAVVVQP